MSTPQKPLLGPLIALVVANLIPLVGIFAFNWSIANVLWLYWWESAVIGFIHIFRIALAKSVPIPAKIILIPFFIFHFGIFMLVHAVALFGVLSGPGVHTFSFSYTLGDPISVSGFAFGILALFVSHAISFLFNYIGKSEYETVEKDTLMKKPYARITVMHLTIMLSGFAFVFVQSGEALGPSFPYAIMLPAILVAIKIIIDVSAHVKAHLKPLATSLVALLLLISPVASFAAHTDGRILLDVENNGEAWYVSPVDGRRYDLGRPEQALEVMRVLGLGITNADLSQIPTNNDGFTGDLALRERLSGRILLQVQSHGEAWYVHPVDLKRYYLGRPEDALQIMSSLGLGITSADLAGIQTGSVHMPDIYYNIPFAAQAPFGEWGDMRQQEGCEETSALMAMKWVTGESLSLEEARSEILAMSDWQKQEFGYFEDTSAHDTATRIFNRWFDYKKVSVEYDISSRDVLDELEAGNVVLVSINGKKVNHDFYTPPGPERHMLLVHGYDVATGELIYHDPGTRFGENLRATFAEMDYMLRDYASGVYAPIGDGRTAMIVVRK